MYILLNKANTFHSHLQRNHYDKRRDSGFDPEIDHFYNFDILLLLVLHMFDKKNDTEHSNYWLNNVPQDKNPDKCFDT